LHLGRVLGLAASFTLLKKLRNVRIVHLLSRASGRETKIDGCVVGVKVEIGGCGRVERTRDKHVYFSLIDFNR